MEIWLFVLFSLSLSLFASLVFNKAITKKKLPPGPPTIPFLGNPRWLKKSFLHIKAQLPELHAKYGPLITLHFGPKPVIVIANRSLAHEALIQKGAIFADRPEVNEAFHFASSNRHNINSAGYGPFWRLLRRNLSSELFHPNRIKSSSGGREWVLNQLLKSLTAQSNPETPNCVMQNFGYAMFSLLLLMCFGQKLDDNMVKLIVMTELYMVVTVFSFDTFVFLPKIVFRKQWKALMDVRKKQEEILVPLITARREEKMKREEQNKENEQSLFLCYVDSLLSLELPEEGGRKLTDSEIVTLCSELLSAGSDTTSTALEWTMARLVKHQDVQMKLYEEIKGVVGEEEELVKEEDLQKMPYLKAVIMESFRRHPPAHFSLPHAVSEDVSLGEYVIPKGITVYFSVVDVGLDGKVWKDPEEFMPERFLQGEEVDVTGRKEITMMPFGVGRRICPGMNLAILILEYFVANLVREFEWKAKEGEEVDLSENPEFTVVMKNHLRAIVVPRRKN